MIIRVKGVGFVAWLLLFVACVEAREELAGLGVKVVESRYLSDLRQPAPGFLVGGQPDTEVLDALAKAGVRHVINMRAQAEHPDFNEATEVAKRGMSYYALPIASAADLTLTKVRALDTALHNASEGSVFMHCASGNRVGAMMALRAALIHGKNTEEAIATGKAWGMTRLEDTVRRLLGDL